MRRVAAELNGALAAAAQQRCSSGCCRSCCCCSSCRRWRLLQELREVQRCRSYRSCTDTGAAHSYRLCAVSGATPFQELHRLGLPCGRVEVLEVCQQIIFSEKISICNLHFRSEGRTNGSNNFLPQVSLYPLHRFGLRYTQVWYSKHEENNRTLQRAQMIGSFAPRRYCDNG